MALARVAAFVSIGVIALSATGCGGAVSSAEPAGSESIEVSASGTVVTFTIGGGLGCDVFDTNSGGGVDCDFAAFTAPQNWSPGVVDTVEVADGTASVIAFKDGHFCVTFDGNRSGAITCSYPRRPAKA